MMDLKINVSENAGISEYVKAETEIDAIIYRREFERHEQEYQKAQSDPELVLAFIYLQIYVECFLHQNMRHIVEMEFKPPRDTVAKDWENHEKDDVRQKLDSFIGKLFPTVPANVAQLTQTIKDNFGKVCVMRNYLAHGHKVAAWSDSDGNSGMSRAKSLLTSAQLVQSKADADALGLAWNDLLDLVLAQCQALQRVDSFKFKNL